MEVFTVVEAGTAKELAHLKILVNNLRDIGYTNKLNVLCTDNSILEKCGFLKNDCSFHCHPAFKDNPGFSKIALWQYTQFNRIMHIDIGQLVLSNLLTQVSEASLASFVAPPMFGASDIFTSRFMLITPDTALYDRFLYCYQHRIGNCANIDLFLNCMLYQWETDERWRLPMGFCMPIELSAVYRVYWNSVQQSNKLCIINFGDIDALISNKDDGDICKNMKKMFQEYLT